MPGEKVQVGMTLTDSSLAGNEVAEATANFTFKDDDEPLSASNNPDGKSKSSVAKKPQRRRRAPKREEPKEETAECGACGADLPLDVDECGVCGAKFG